jgi:hypothetical protein
MVIGRSAWLTSFFAVDGPDFASLGDLDFFQCSSLTTLFRGVLLLRAARTNSRCAGSTHLELFRLGVDSAVFVSSFPREARRVFCCSGSLLSSSALKSDMLLMLGFGEATAAFCSCHCRMRSRTELASYRSSGLLSEALDVGGALRRLFDARRGVVGAEGIGEHVVQEASYAETSPSAVGCWCRNPRCVSSFGNVDDINGWLFCPLAACCVSRIHLR